MQGKPRALSGQIQDRVHLSEALDAARSGRAYARRDEISVVEFTGADRHRFLNGLVTCDVANLQAGQSVYGFCTSIQGKILSDLWVTSFEESLLLEAPRDRAGFLEEHLSKYRIADRVEIKRRSDVVAVTVFQAKGELLGAFDRSRKEGAVRIESVVGAAISLPRIVAGIEAEVLWAGQSEIEGWIEALDAAGKRTMDAGEWNCLHVEAGQLRYGIDFDERNFPQETGLADLGVSYTKGCYLGQEVVARIHYRGGVQRLPRGLRFDSGLPEGEELLLEDRAVGRIGATATSPTLGPIGLAIVHQRGAEVGIVLRTTNGGNAVVVELPFAVEPRG
jgi:folate-binding protein YgfZ